MSVKRILFLNSRHEPVKNYKLTTLPIKERMIISKSIEFFNDPEPCFIHRSAVLKRLMAEMEEFFYHLSEEGIFEINCSAFNEKFSDMLNFEEDVQSLRFEL